MAHTLVYWSIRGLAGPIRLSFAYAGKELKEEFYHETDANGNLQDLWGPVYEKMKAEQHPFPNLPYLITPDGKLLMQSGAILRYAGRLFDLYGPSSDPFAQAKVDELLEEIVDIRSEGSANFYSTDGIKESYINGTVPYAYGVLNAVLSANGGQPFAFGPKPTIADFAAYEALRIPLGIPAIVEKREQMEKDYPHVFAFFKAIEALPELQEFLKSDVNAKFPINGAEANYGSKPFA